MMQIDVAFDFRSDSGGKDPDSASQTLREYHRVLWSKTLPSGSDFMLELGNSPYLLANGSHGYEKFSSDTITNSLGSHRSMQQVIMKSHEELIQQTRDIGSTIGARIIFPAAQVAGQRTINVLRGLHPLIRDRFDLTLECIKTNFNSLPVVLPRVISISQI